MQKLLFKRTLRDLKSNFFRYMALFLLIILCMFIVVGTIGSAVSVIESVNKRAEANHLEDGQFGVFVPLDKKTLQELKHMRVTLEECFYLDFLMEDASTLRVMKNRESLNLVNLEEGAPAYFPGEIIVERIYAAAHDRSPLRGHPRKSRKARKSRDGISEALCPALPLFPPLSWPEPSAVFHPPD